MCLRLSTATVRRGTRPLGLLMLALAAGASLPEPRAAQDGSAPANAEPAEQELQLEAFVNGIDKQLIIALRLREGRLFTAPSELRELGIDARGVAQDSEGLVALDAVRGLRYTYQR